MKIYLEHDAAMLAGLAGQQAPACDGLIVADGKLDDVLAATVRSNPLSDQWLLDAELPSRRTVTWSGTLGEDLLEASPLTWMRPGREAFAEFCQSIAGQLVWHRRTLCFQPHSRHVLSDVQSCFNFIREQANVAGPFEMALSPGTMFEPSMMGAKDAADHLDRMFATLGGHCAMVFLSDVRIAESGGEERCEQVPLGDGVLPMTLIRKLLKEHVPPTTPIVLSPQKLEQQIAALRRG